MSKKITMQQIADQVGVSKFAVSKALAGKTGVSAETREKIIAAATQLGYFAIKKTKPSSSVYKSSGETADGSQRDTIIVLIPNVRYQNRHSFYWGRIIDGITNALEEHRIGMMIVTEHITDNFAHLINTNGVLGLISVGMISNQLLLEIRNLGIPFVMVDHEDPLIPSDSLFMNNYEGVRRVTSYLLANGHRKLQFAGNPRYSRYFTDRWHGYRAALEEQCIPLNQYPDLLTFECDNPSEMTKALDGILYSLERDQGLPTAFVCGNDAIALCVMAVLMQMGIDIPGQVSVVGFDNIDDAAMSTPTLSTVNVNKVALGERAVDTLLWRIANLDRPKECILLSGDIVIRESTGPMPA